MAVRTNIAENGHRSPVRCLECSKPLGLLRDWIVLEGQPDSRGRHVLEKSPPTRQYVAMLSTFERKNRTLLKSLKGECIPSGAPLSLVDAWRLVEGHVEHYNDDRLNSAIAEVLGRRFGPLHGKPTFGQVGGGKHFGVGEDLSRQISLTLVTRQSDRGRPTSALGQ